jgi:WD40 repeat protein
MVNLDMKKLVVVILIICGSEIFAQNAEVAFTIKEKDIISEGIAYDPTSKTFYLGSIHKQKIMRISSDGTVSDFVKTGQDGINEVLGMKVDGSGMLWACHNTPEYDTINKVSGIHVYDVRTGKLSKTFKLADGNKHLFNDLHFTDNGDTYVTDSDGGGVYVIRKGSDVIETFLKPGSLRYPNGISSTADNKKILISTGSALGIVSVDVESKEVKQIPHVKFLIIGTDGLYRYKNTLIGVQNVLFPEGILKFTLNADATSVIGMDFLASNDPMFDTPTTGVIVGDEFYFIANSQLLQIIGNKGKIKEPQDLKETFIMKIKLN